MYQDMQIFMAHDSNDDSLWQYASDVEQTTLKNAFQKTLCLAFFCGSASDRYWTHDLFGSAMFRIFPRFQMVEVGRIA
jgi:hypothetical protein